jgi:hypothetical protein
MSATPLSRRDCPTIARRFSRLASIRRSVTVTLAMLNTVSYSLGEPIQ